MKQLNFLTSSGTPGLGSTQLKTTLRVGKDSLLTSLRSILLIFAFILGVGNVLGDTYTRLESIASIDESAEYVLGIDGTGFHYTGTSSWGTIALPSAQTPLKYTLNKTNNGTTFTAKTTISNTVYYLTVPGSNNTFTMSTNSTDLRLGTTTTDTDNSYAIANTSTTTRHIRVGASGLRSYANTTGNMAFFYKVTSSNPCTVTWHVNGGTTTAGGPTTNSTTGSKVTKLPTAPTSSACDGSKVFVGWTKTPIDGTTNTKPADLFSTVAQSPELKGNTDFYAVFANQVSAGGSSATLFDISDYSAIPTNWSNHNVGVGSYFCFDAGGDSLTSPLQTPHNNVQVTCSVATYGGTTGSTNHPLTVYLLDAEGNIKDTKTTATPSSSSYVSSGTLSFGDIDYSFKIRFYLPSANKGARLRTPKCTGTTLPTYNGYRTSCCTPLAQINGSFSLNHFSCHVETDQICKP